MRRVIVNADDFGLSAGVSAGIAEAHSRGVVTSTSMMVHLAGWDDALRLAGATPSLRVGLHVNLLVGEPLTVGDSLRDRRTGCFLPFGAFVRRILSRGIDAAEVEAECEAQLAALRGAGLRVTHIDSHRHTHAMPGVRRGVAAVALRHDLPLRRPVDSGARGLRDLPSSPHRALLASAWRATSRRELASRSTDYFAGVTLQGQRNFAERLIALASRLRNGTTEIMVHPGHVDADLATTDTYTAPRERELAALCSASVRRAFEDPGIARITFADC